MPAEEALTALRELPGVGPFTADAVLYRGCGVADGLPGSDELGQTVIKDLYGLEDAGRADVERLADAWRPYRMWTVVLLRMGWTRAQGRDVSYRTR
jgi:DNA-3-methyladenine glycosylase II